MHSSVMQNYLIKRSLISPPIAIPEHIKQFFQRFKKAFPDDGEPVEKGIATEDEVEYSQQLLENMRFVTTNYILLKNIFSNFKTWQELRLLSSVSKTWADVIHNMINKDIEPRYFCQHSKKNLFQFDHNLEFNVEPALVLMFISTAGVKAKCTCTLFPENPCWANCKESHKVLDYLFTRLCYPKNVLIAHECIKLVYSPPAATLPPQVGSSTTPLKLQFNREKDACLCGIYFPKIPGVEMITMNIKSHHNIAESQQEFTARILKMLETKTIKCILMFSRGFENLEMLDLLMKLIESLDNPPVAVGGCCIQRSCTEDFVYAHCRRSLEAVFTMITVDKNVDAQFDFDAYSKVFTQEDATESDLVMEMKKMSDAIPRRSHSAALKLSCVGRYSFADNLEDRLFRNFFPTTSLVGCYGQGELGCDSLPTLPVQKGKSVYSLTHSYSSVFVVFTWGKLL